ncbi:hypothetical protein [Motilimonas sp. E26]|uniref:hypothetical protein n=1 Tax=Motilimonas sp. E26 TaxID=2865674 RepID=UPI001E574FE5|nr:hypothetical protein [Motilimonas sp. E26]MCE0557104.1 hypothetical protein [Motilimonas sp. E26]
MKKLGLLTLGALFSFSAFSAELSESALQGDWLVSHFQNESDNDNTLWQFQGNQFIQNLDGMKVAPDSYKVSPGVIDLGYAKITVTEFDGENMEAVMAGFKYKLIKQ